MKGGDGMPKSAPGRMISQSISLSDKIAQLSQESMALFCLLIPHFNSYGKMLADPHAIKGNVCPLVSWLTVEKIAECLVEISAKTNVRWWRDDKGLCYLQSLNWNEHQNLRKDRLGLDYLPDYPGENNITPGQLQDHSRFTPAEEKLSKEKNKKKVTSKLSSDSLRLSGLLADLIEENNPTNRSVSEEKREKSTTVWAIEIDRMIRIDMRSVDEIEEVINWCQRDCFWQANILSGAKLRKQYDQLAVQMQKSESPTGKSRTAVPLAAGRRVF
jgi:hypothetical protein